MYRLESIDLGTYRGANYVLVGFVEPEPAERAAYDPDTDADNYGVTLVRVGTGPLETNTEIVRLDTSHGQPHVDRVYLPPDADTTRKIWLDDDYTYTRMKQYVVSNWQWFVDAYVQYQD